MNGSSLRPFFRTLAQLSGKVTPPVLCYVLARHLAGENAPWLSHFAPVQAVPAQLLRQAEELLRPYVPQPEGTPNALTAEVLAQLGELSTPNRRASGTFYTPFPVARHLARRLLFSLLTRQARLTQNEAQSLLDGRLLPAVPAHAVDAFLSGLTVCDPACGAGSLLVPFALELAQIRHLLSPKSAPAALLTHIFTHNLYASDISGEALVNLKLRLALLLHKAGGTPDVHTLLPHSFCASALACRGQKTIFQARFAQVFAAQNGFDALLANPPYIGQKNHRALFDGLRHNPLWGPYFTPKSDLLYFFFYLSLSLVRPGGISALLTTPYFATAAGAGPLRQTLKREAAFLYLEDFGSHRLFKQALGHHSLISVFEKNATPHKPPCQMGRLSVTQTSLYHSAENYLRTQDTGDLQNALAKMAACAQKLQDVASVTNGLMTGCDKISALHLKKHPLKNIHPGDGVFVLSQRERQCLPLSAAEAARLKPFYKNSQIHPYAAAQKPEFFLIDFFYPNDRHTDFSQYPVLKKHLARFAPILLARKQNNNGIDKALKRGEYWFGSVRRKMDFEADKLAVPQRSPRNTFAFAPGPWYASSDVYFISTPTSGTTLWYLLALFNSAPYYAWLYFNGKRKGNLLELYAAPLKALPVPMAPPNKQKELEDLARRLYAAKKANPQADVSALQAQADAAVCALFGFSSQETKAVLSFFAAHKPTPKKL